MFRRGLDVAEQTGTTDVDCQPAKGGRAHRNGAARKMLSGLLLTSFSFAKKRLFKLCLQRLMK